MLGLAREIWNFYRKRKNERWVIADKNAFLKQLTLHDSRPWQVCPDFLCSGDKTKSTGFDRHYLFHPAWAFRILVDNIKPEKHIDISSTLYFCSMLSAIMPVDFYDYRPAKIKLSNLNCFSGDLIALPFETNSITSISCMHTVEHIGLGRYGDTVDALGDIKAMNELQRVIAPGGSLLFVTPVADCNLIQFNAHRVYKPEQIIETFNDLILQEFYYIPSYDAEPRLMQGNSEYIKGEKYGCGCFWFKKQI
jgi:SAM-dependent methyltransferase